jgi:hypothetical protein
MKRAHLMHDDTPQMSGSMGIHQHQHLEYGIHDDTWKKMQ